LRGAKQKCHNAHRNSAAAGDLALQRQQRGVTTRRKGDIDSEEGGKAV